MSSGFFEGRSSELVLKKKMQAQLAEQTRNIQRREGWKAPNGWKVQRGKKKPPENLVEHFDPPPQKKVVIQSFVTFSSII
ncbi:hypothetical protein PVAP13_3NG210951 [Panicum virgatum]|uniref:Uncharacterized protein n=1 Tax=Panicum virgatum TaxID=38727 RepID=A0A8T0U2E8_PANVG|nr:hypothetical protein PVAP13_3NG210951 [Panicum virgatum]